MKEYKIVSGIRPNKLENQINELAAQGFVVKFFRDNAFVLEREKD